MVTVVGGAGCTVLFLGLIGIVRRVHLIDLGELEILDLVYRLTQE